MHDLKRKGIYCPKSEEHAHPKILILLSDDKLTVHCHEHQWIDIQFVKGGEIMKFNDVSVKLSDVKKNTQFELEEIPTLAIGPFKTKKKRIYANN
jgi:hypothetical protein